MIDCWVFLPLTFAAGCVVGAGFALFVVLRLR